MICPKCLSDIPDDSSYCDQCGIKILICPACGKIGTEKYCPADHSLMEENAPDKSFSVNKFFRTERKQKLSRNTSLKFTNKTLNIEFTLGDNDVIGRKEEKFLQIFSKYKQISSKHAVVKFNSQLGWTITDLNSTNGTKLNDTQLEALTPAVIKNGDKVVFANIEFYIVFERI